MSGTRDKIVLRHLKRLNQTLPEEWEAILCSKQGRIYYINHHSQTSQWLPPRENWPDEKGTPYGWEPAVDKENKPYIINHESSTTQRPDPSMPPDPGPPPEEDEINNPQPRDIELERDPKMGFGFVAGSEKPVIVRFLTEGGPSENKLMPGDRITHINGENVEKAPREHVIELVRSSTSLIKLTVCQPVLDNSQRKSALLTAAKKARLKNNPSRVRFAEAVIVNGAPVINPSTHESYIPFMPNVLKVFLENGQTKSFKYDTKTTVQDVVDSLQEKLNIKCIQHFSLVLQNMKNPSHNKMMLLHPHESLSEIAARPGSQHLKCLFRLTFIPRDPYDLVQKDSTAFDYLFTQCTNDVVQERFSSELKVDTAFRLSALHIHQHAAANNMAKINLKHIEREPGLDKFVPSSILDSHKAKEVRKLLNHHIKANGSLTAPGQKQLTALQAKMHYLKLVSEVRSFGGKYFLATLVELQQEAMVVIGPRYGIASITNPKTFVVNRLLDFDQVESVTLAREDRETMQRVILNTQDNEKPHYSFIMLTEDVHDFIALLEGYYRVLVDPDNPLRIDDDCGNNNTDDAPAYNGPHRVVSQPWSYPEDSSSENTHIVDLSAPPPPYRGYLDKLHNDFTKQVQNTEYFERAEGIDLDRTRDELQVTSQELKISDAPLASPDISVLSGSSESSLVQTQSSDSVAAGLWTQSPDEDEDDDHGEVTETEEESEVITEIEATITEGESDEENETETECESFTIAQSEEFMRDSDLCTAQSSSFTVSDNNMEATESEKQLNGDVRKGEESVKLIAVRLTDQPSLLGVNTNKVNGTESLQERVVEAEVHEIEANHNGVKNEQKVPEDIDDETETDDDRKGPPTSESSDTDSVNTTPTDSPAKARLDGVTFRPPSLSRTRNSERPNSFGLHSPDTLPQSEEEFTNLAQTFGLSSPDKPSGPVPQDLLHPSYNPQIFHDGGLYLDPDIIDLTLIPPPKTPDEDYIDFSSPTMTTPPQGFSDSSGQSSDPLEQLADLSVLPESLFDLPGPIREKIDSLVNNDEDLGTQLSSIDALLLDDMRKCMADNDNEKESGIESESDSGNETVSSENVEFSGINHCDLVTSAPLSRQHKSGPADLMNQLASRQSYRHIDFTSQDIDAFIASVTVPPPPAVNNEPDIVLDTSHKQNCKTEKNSEQVPPLPALPPPCDIVEEDVSPCLQHSPSPGKSSYEDNSLPPPPPASESAELDNDEIELLLDRKHFSPVYEQDIDAELAKYIIPAPPPSDSETEYVDIRIVTPPNVKTPSPECEHKDGNINNSSSNATGEEVQEKFLSEKDLHMEIAANSVQEAIEHAKAGEKSVKDTIKQLEKTSNIVTIKDSSPCRADKSSSGSIKRPTTAPPPPPGSSPRQLPPAPPRRFSSLEPTSTISSAPTTPSTNGPESKTSIEINVRNNHLLSGNIGSLSADSSPLHHPLAQTNSLGTLTRRNNKTRAPAPPPRRSSIAGGADSVETVATRIKLLQSQSNGKAPNYENVLKEEPQEAFVPIKITGKSLPKIESSVPSSPGSPRSPRVVSASIQARQEALRQAAFKKQEKPNLSVSVPNTPVSCSEISVTSPITPGTPNTSGMEMVAIVPGSPKPSPVLGRSSTFTPGSGAMPRPYQSPKHSPLVQRHSSFARTSLSDSQRSPSPLRTFLGERASVSSDSESSAPSSPWQNQGGAFQYPGTLGRAAGLRNTPAQVKKAHQRKSIPFKVVHPMITSTASSSEEDTSSFSSADIVTRSLDLATTDTSLSPESVTHSFDFSNSKIPPWRNKGTQPSFLSAGSGSKLPSSPKKSGTGLVQSLRQAIQNRPSFSTFRTDKGKKASPVSSPTHKPNGLETDGKSSPLATIGPVRNMSSSQVASSPVAVQPVTIDDKLSKFEQLSGASKLTRPTLNSKSPSSVPTTNIPRKEGKRNMFDSDPMVDILNRVYEGENAISDANSDIEKLLKYLQQQIDACRKPGSSMDLDLRKSKDALVSESRQFVTDSKLLVSSATQSKEKLVINVNQSLHTLAKITQQCTRTMVCIPAPPQAVTLGSRVKDVALAYKTTVNAAQQAAGKPLSDPNMKMLMRQATSLAAILSALMKTLKMLEAS